MERIFTVSDTGSATGAPPTRLLVLGGGPGGYTAAFRAADLGLEVMLVDARETLGGVCLNVGCIPSKALLHVARIIDEAMGLADAGVAFGEPRLDLPALRAFRDRTIAQLTTGLAGLARRRKIRVLRGSGCFVGPHEIELTGPDGPTRITFDRAVIACGSEAMRLPILPDDPRIIDSTRALALDDVPERLLILGGGIIGLEMAQIYHALGSTITIAEMADRLLPGADPDIVAPLEKRIQAQYRDIRLSTRITGATADGSGIEASFDRAGETDTDRFDRILVATGRKPNGNRIGAEAAGVVVDGEGFIPVDKQMRTNLPHIFAVGDVVGQPMLAHKAAHQGKVAAEVAAGLQAAFEPVAIPAVIYTDPEIAYAGLTENEARMHGTPYKKGVFPWAASGRATACGTATGTTKLLFDPDTRRLLGGAVSGSGAGELITEIVLAMEMGAVAEDLALTIHPHPTLSETIGFAADAFCGTLTDL